MKDDIESVNNVAKDQPTSETKNVVIIADKEFELGVSKEQDNDLKRLQRIVEKEKGHC